MNDADATTPPKSRIILVQTNWESLFDWFIVGLLFTTLICAGFCASFEGMLERGGIIGSFLEMSNHQADNVVAHQGGTVSIGGGVADTYRRITNLFIFESFILEQ
jgi:hypothetical protein